MRASFISFLEAAATTDPKLYLIAGDVGFSVIESFKGQYKHRYLNAGVAEQNMIGVAAGLAMMGKRPYVYSIVPFVTLRCYEQIRNDLCYQQLPVKLVGVGGGFQYGAMGTTHHAIEDVGALRLLPNMTVVVPATKAELEALMPQIHAHNGPLYLRLSALTLALEGKVPPVLGQPYELIPGDDILIIGSGYGVELGHQIQQQLSSEGIACGLVSLHTVSPFPIEWFAKRRPKAIFTIEEHFITGGIGEAVARIIAEAYDYKVIFKAFGIPHQYGHEIGNCTWLRNKAGLTTDAILPQIKHQLELLRQQQSKYCAYSKLQSIRDNH